MRLQSPLRRWEVLAGLCQSLNATDFVEVGCKEGRTTGYLLANLPDLRVTAIDPWAPVANSAENYADWDFAQIEAEFWKNVGEHKERCNMLRTVSTEAAERFRDGTQDIVFIDAGHDYESCLADIRAWFPKVRAGGILCGHDYQHKFPGVHRAVAEVFPLLRVAVMPDAIWLVQKDETLRAAA